DDRNQSRPRLDEALARLRAILHRYGVSEDGADDTWRDGEAVARLPQNDRERLQAEVGEAFYSLAEAASLIASAADAGTQDRLAHQAMAERWHAAAERHAAGHIPRALASQRRGLDDLRAGRPGGEHSEPFEPTDGLSPRDLYLLGARLTRQGE